MRHKKYPKCINCESTRNVHKSRGYCKRCYPIQLRVEKAEQWDFNNPITLKTFPKGFSNIDEGTFMKIKKGVIIQLKERLDWFRIREQRLKGDIFGIDIEYGLNRIANYCGVRDKSLFHSSANTFDHNFNMKQKKIIFEYIDRIEQNIDWRGIDWYKVFFQN
jgi:hypothetical protein